MDEMTFSCTKAEAGVLDVFERLQGVLCDEDQLLSFVCVRCGDEFSASESESEEIIACPVCGVSGERFFESWRF